MIYLLPYIDNAHDDTYRPTLNSTAKFNRISPFGIDRWVVFVSVVNYEYLGQYHDIDEAKQALDVALVDRGCTILTAEQAKKIEILAV
jgi:hypothetical protein